MKRLLVICAVLSILTACKEQESGNTTTPKGIIIEAVTALSKNDSVGFQKLVEGAALQKYGSESMQKELYKSLGDVRKITLGSEKVVSHNVVANVTTTVSTIDVIKKGSAIYTVSIRCEEKVTTSSHTVCTSPEPYYPPSHSYNPPPRHDHDYDRGNSGSWGGGGSWGGNDSGGGGYITPGVTHEVPAGSSSDDGHKPGNNDPDRPPRFAAVYGEECHQVTDTDRSVSCKIIDLQ